MRLGVHARGGVRVRGTTTLPAITGPLDITGDITATGTATITGALASGAITSTGLVKGTRLWATGLGSLAAPAVAIGVLGDTGAFSTAVSNLSFGVEGNTPCLFTDSVTTLNATTMNGSLSMGSGARILADYGTAALPGVGFNGNTGLGIYRNQADGMGFACGAANQMALDAVLLTVNPSAGIFLGAGYLSMVERTAPTAVADRVHFYGEDVAGKTAGRAKAGTAGTVATLVLEV